jgi:hypothetical protein
MTEPNYMTYREIGELRESERCSKFPPGSYLTHDNLPAYFELYEKQERQLYLTKEEHELKVTEAVLEVHKEYENYIAKTLASERQRLRKCVDKYFEDIEDDNHWMPVIRDDIIELLEAK